MEIYNTTIKFNLLFKPNTKINNIKKYVHAILSNFKLISLNFKKQNEIYLIEVIYSKEVSINDFKNKEGFWKILTINNVKVKNYYVLIKHFNENDKNKIYNLFSLFGNIKEIITDKYNDKYFIINYFSYKAVILVIQNLNKIKYDNLFINIEKYKKFFYDPEYFEKLIINPNLFRYKNNNNYQINTPSNKIFFKNVSKEITKYNFLVLNKSVSEMIKFKILKQKGRYINYLVEYPNISIAIKAIMNFHNYINNNLRFTFKINVYFSHRKFN